MHIYLSFINVIILHMFLIHGVIHKKNEPPAPSHPSRHFPFRIYHITQKCVKKNVKFAYFYEKFYSSRFFFTARCCFFRLLRLRPFKWELTNSMVHGGTETKTNL